MNLHEQINSIFQFKDRAAGGQDDLRQVRGRIVQSRHAQAVRSHVYPRKLTERLQGLIQQVFPNWTHRRHRSIWDRKWDNPAFDPFWKTNQPQKELVEAVESDWFPRNQRVIDIGCGNGEVSRWLASQGFAVLGLDYSMAAIENCRNLSSGQANPPTFEVADLCGEDLQLEPAASLVDRGCFHRIVENLRPIFAQNIARATVKAGHFLLLAATFKDPRAAHYTGVRSAQELREHVGEIFGNYFTIERTEPAVINASKGRKAMTAVAFWMVRHTGRVARQT